MPSTFSGFHPEALMFLRRLKRNNDREWFLKNKHVYEQTVKAPMVELVLALGRELKKIAPEMETDPARAIYRIYRDVRFSPDKSPYKTHIAAIFRPRTLEKHNCAGLYFHVSPSELEIAGGVYMPERETLLAIRQHIAVNHRKLRSILESPEFRRLFGELWGEQLRRVPKGFAPDHPAADLLRYKQLLADVAHPADLACSPRVLPTLAESFQVMMPLVRFLNAPLKARPAAGLARKL
jgi:uncharacterized protein (TIGR02453 family)